MKSEQYEQRLVAILYADVAGYSRLTGADEAGTHRALSTYLDLFAEAVNRHLGKVVHYAGDAILAEFGMVSDALTCAINVQQDLQERNKELPEERQVRFRIGVNLGEVIVDRDDIYGEGVNIAARLEGLAEPGGVCVSDAVRNAVGRKLPLDYEFMGEQEVKNIEEPVRAYHARLASGAELPRPTAPRRTGPNWHRLTGIAAAVVLLVVGSVVLLKPWESTEEPVSVEQMAFPLPDKPSIAVLPFENMSGDPQQEYFSDGITEDVITDLSKLSGLFVISRNSTFTYKGKPVKVRQVAEELGVRYVLEGSVRRAGDQVRITAQLIDATTGGHVWAERYDGALTDVFALQDDVTQKIVAALAVKVTDEEQVHQGRHGTENPDAYDAFLQGWAHYQLRTPDDLANAVPYLEEAIRLDANYARAHAALASVYWDAWNNGWHKNLNVRSFRARKLADDHLEEAMKSPTPLAHSLKSRMLVATKSMDAQSEIYEEAVAEAHRAVSLDSNDATAYAALANALVYAGKPAEGADFIRKAMRLDPHYPPDYLIMLGRTQFELDQYEEAVETFERAVKRNLDNKWAWIYLAATYGQLGRENEGQAAMETFNVFRAEAELPELNVKSIDLTRFGGSATQERVGTGLSALPPSQWKTLLSFSESGNATVNGATAIDIGKAKELHERGVRFIDARAEDDWFEGHIPRAFSLSVVRSSESRLTQIVDKLEEVVFYCNCPEPSACNLSPHASAKAVAWGYKNVYYIKGAIDAWDTAGYPLEKQE
jgi:TolB-like protein/class 3 adenylate cyclase/rhodanese-related sulfurtransferase